MNPGQNDSAPTESTRAGNLFGFVIPRQPASSALFDNDLTESTSHTPLGPEFFHLTQPSFPHRSENAYRAPFANEAAKWLALYKYTTGIRLDRRRGEIDASKGVPLRYRLRARRCGTLGARRRVLASKHDGLERRPESRVDLRPRGAQFLAIG